jgi:lincosamide and streptogramin A transport system ATP-binding/permease protein
MTVRRMLYLKMSAYKLIHRGNSVLSAETGEAKPNVFLLIDEPTNHLDTIGREILARYLEKKSGFILVSHDRKVLDETVDHIISINRANIVVLQGNFSVWEQNKAYQDAFELAENEKLKKDIKRLEISTRRASDWSDKTEKSKKSAADRGFIGHKAAKMMSKAKNIEDRKNSVLTKVYSNQFSEN